MSKSAILVDFEGAITLGTIEMLLNRLRSTSAFQAMEKPTRKRLYSIFVESIDNIFKYGARMPGEHRNSFRAPKISVFTKKGRIHVKSGNLVLKDEIEDLKFKLDRVNQLDNEALKTLYEEVINKETGIYDSGAGLGLITMAMRTDTDIRYTFTPVDEDYSFFEMEITVNG
jgi:hypothetical protein